MKISDIIVFLVFSFSLSKSVASTEDANPAKAVEDVKRDTTGQSGSKKMLRGSSYQQTTPISSKEKETSVTESIMSLVEVDAAKLLNEAICYAERYLDLLQGFCQGDSSLCSYEALWSHYQEHGKASNLLWGCRSRVKEHAVPLVPVPSAPDAFIGDSDDTMELHFLIFETSDQEDDETTLIEQTVAAGFRTTRIGRGATFKGFSTKWQVILKFLKDLSSSTDTLLVITDARDVLLNIHNDYINQEDISKSMAKHFTNAYKTLTASAPNAIVMSAEAQCCVAALTFAELGSYFDKDGRRSQRACASGKEGCTWGGDSNVVVWEDFQIDLAYNYTGRSVHDVYLNAGLAAGRVADWIRLLEAVDLEEYEDDQAVFTDYMYHRPDQIVLDYASEMFGSARWPLGMGREGCPFGEVEVYDEMYGQAFPTLRHLESNSLPLLLHTPGKFFECYDQIAEELGLAVAEDNIDSGEVGLSQTNEAERHLKQSKQQKQKAKQIGQQSKPQNQVNQQNNDKKTKKPQNAKNKKTKKPKNYVVRVRAF